ncbi:MAG: hypothetical protein ABIP48_05430, partial [Planctomycetota bacterium]
EIECITHIINYYVQSYPEDYVLRIGRTARAHSSGTAITLMSPDEAVALQAIERFLGEKIPVQDLDDFEYAPRLMPLAQAKPADPFSKAKRRPRAGAAARAARFTVRKR